MKHNCAFCETKTTDDCLGDKERFWFCPHLQAQICELCCVFDSLDPSFNWVECKTCKHDKDRQAFKKHILDGLTKGKFKPVKTKLAKSIRRVRKY
jgi:hypothetical protein